MQLAAIVLPWYVPAEQLVQDVESAVEYVPTEQLKHDAVPEDASYVPAEQAEQVLAPAAE